ncbi:MAG TPA: sugar transferase [Paracoccaceae bacterium]|nr:sugar transferase [Paracoccaceae bacterium]
MTPGKRALDLALVLVAAVLLAVPFAVLVLVLWATQGRPILYDSLRMTAPGRPFRLWKLRTMRPDPGDSGVTGADKAGRITPMGRFLRRTRLDEVPQIWNVIRGDISLVGPRPPLPVYVDRFPDLYARVLRSRPGVTGLATLVFHRHEERLLAACRTPEETDAVYARRCVPRKARLDLIYQHRRTVGLDLWILARTIRAALFRRR